MSGASLRDALGRALERHGLSEAVAPDAHAPLADFAERLLRHGARANLVGIHDPERLLDEVIVDSLHALPLLEPSGHLVDIGSGAGIPGIVLAIARPQWRVSSVEPRAKRVAFQQATRRALGLSNLTIHEARHEAGEPLPSGVEEPVDAAITKAVWDTASWLGRGLPLVRPGGRVIAYQNGGAPEVARGRLVGSRAYRLADGRARCVIAVSEPAEGA